MRGIKIPQYEFALKMQGGGRGGGLMHEGGTYLQDTTVHITCKKTRQIKRVKCMKKQEMVRDC